MRQASPVRMVHRAAAIALSAMLAGCFPRYLNPRIQTWPEADGELISIASLLLEHPSVELVVVHGMCRHDEAGWVDQEWTPQLTRALGLAERELGARPVVAPIERDAVFSTKRKYQLGSREIRATYVLWSGATDPLKDSLAFDNLRQEGGEYLYKRALLNARFKRRLVNECLSDPVIYAGQHGAALREAIKREICKALGLSYDSANRTCAVGTAEQRTDPVLLIRESLGSKLAFDALLELQASNEKAAKAALGRVRAIHMFANQLPLLRLAESPDNAPLTGRSGLALTPRDTLMEIARALSESHRGELRQQDVQLIAYSDPNDLLTYALPNKGQQWPDGIRVANVVVSNAGTFMGFLFENPHAAHTGHKANDRVMSLAICGKEKRACRQLGKRENKP